MPKKQKAWRKRRIRQARRATTLRRSARRFPARCSLNLARVTITAGVVSETPLELNFSSPRDLFKSLIHPVLEDEFFSEFWEKKPLLITRGGGNIPLFTLETLRELVRHDLRPLSFGRHVNISRYKGGRRLCYGAPGETLTAEQLERFWTKKKATVQFLQPQHFQVWYKTQLTKLSGIL